MAVSNKKKKQIKRLHPAKSVKEIAAELGLKEREVEGVIGELGPGKPSARPAKPVPVAPAAKTNRLAINLAVAILIAGLSAAAYGQSLGYGFVADDKFLILQNPLVTGKGEFSKIFTVRYFEYFQNQGVYYRPFTTLSYWFNFRLGQTNPFNYHLLNLLMNSAVSVLAFFVFGKWARNWEVGAITGILFAAHPAHTQSVSWISGRCDLMVALLGLLILWLFLSSRDRGERMDGKTLVAANLCFGLALFSKEAAMILPALILAADLLRPGSSRFRIDRPRAVFYGSLALPAAIYLYARFKVLGVPFGYTQQPDYQWYAMGAQDVSRAVMVFKIYYYHLQTLLYPTKLCFECKLNPSYSWLQPQVLISIVGILAAIELAWISKLRLPEIALGISWFFLGLLLVSNIIPIQEIAMEQFLYLPSLGFCLALAGAISGLYRNKTDAGRKLARGLAIAILTVISSLYLILTVARNPVWKNNLTIFSDAVKKAPMKSRTQGALAETLAEGGNLPGAIRAYRRAIRAEPDSASAHYNLANSYLDLKQYDQAISEYREAITYDPTHIKAQNNLGYVLEKTGDLEAAAQSYQSALNLNPGFYSSLSNLTRVYIKLGRCEEAWDSANRLGANAPDYLSKLLREKCPR